MNGAVLLILFNHKYEANLDRLRILYNDRFTNIYFIMPFYKGSAKDVITVYGNSYNFQNYIAQALQQLKNHKFEHYIVIGDDLYLNPNINENNYKHEFNLKYDTAFIPEIFLLNNYREQPRLIMNGFDKWTWNFNALRFNYKNVPGIEVNNELPTERDAIKAINNNGYEFTSEINLEQLVGSKHNITNIFQIKNILSNIKSRFFWRKNYIKYSSIESRTLKYPMVGSYSDLVIIPGTSINNFMHYCGVFGALDLFVEIAIPTAAVLSTKTIIQEKDLQKKGVTLWSKEEFDKLKNTYDSKLNNLSSNFPENVLYIHPVKLSQWN